jgi:hypothetical protein
MPTIEEKPVTAHDEMPADREKMGLEGDDEQVVVQQFDPVFVKKTMRKVSLNGRFGLSARGEVCD